MDGKLFSQDFLLDGIKTTPVWEELSETVLDALNCIYAPLSADSKLKEANTETDIIEKAVQVGRG